MGSKTPPLNWSSPEAHPEDDLVRRPDPSDGSAASLLLRRIAGALQVPPSTLYNPPNAVGSTPNGDIESECLTLLRAYQGVRDPEERRRLLALVQEATGRF